MAQKKTSQAVICKMAEKSIETIVNEAYADQKILALFCEQQINLFGIFKQ